MATIILSGTPREGSGKGPARQLRMGGSVPAIMYGAGEECVKLTLNRHELEKALSHRGGGNMIVKLSLGGAEKMSLIREVQRDPLSRKILHIDFQHISMTQKLTVKVPVSTVGIPEGAKTFGGILEFVTREIEVRCLAGDIPERITVDVSALGVHDAIHVRDIKVDKVEITSDPDLVVATVAAPTVIEEAKPAAEGEAPKEPELIGKDKAAEEAEAAADKGSEKKK